jgi:hypothetical protein
VEPALQALRDRGWEVEVDCFTATSEYLHLPAGMLAAFGGLGVDLAVTFSADGKSSAAEPATTGDRAGTS